LYVNGLYLEATIANLITGKPEVHKVVGDLAWERSTTRGWVSDDFETYQTAAYGWKTSLVRWLRGWWSRRADRIIVPSEYLGRWVRSWGVPENKIEVIYNGIELHPVAAEADLVFPTPTNLATIARLVSWKRIEGIIDAVSQLDDVGLIVTGDGPLRHDLEEHALRCGVAGRVFFAGTRNSSEIPSILAACDVFVLNSTYEGLPHVVLEAMAAGLPVVATAVGGTPEVVQNGTNGLLVDPNDPDELLNALSRLVADPALRRKLAQRGTDTVKGFTNQRMFEETESVLSQDADSLA
jgi:glycosyltransferase involved in cell wall biosynthesis